MTADELKKRQKAERDRCLQEILESDAPKKVIVAGAGTGKTFTFGQVLKLRAGGTNLAMTFIKRLVADMEPKLGASAEVKTFHAYCKKILHEQNGKVELAPFLTRVIERDAQFLGNGFLDFDAKFQTLDEGSPALNFHLKRGDYYDAVGFDDAVYRLYKLLQDNSDVLPAFDQILIDEFQDFHRLEVAFIEELSKKGDILIVGDDDQAVYPRRNASPQHLRELHKSPKFKTFDLPFCTRCPEAIVQASNAIARHAQEAGHLRDRIPRNYECYWDAKEQDSKTYPRIVYAVCTLARMIPRYIEREILLIPPEDIKESHKEGEEYPTVLIIGPKQYLREVEKYFKEAEIAFAYTPSDDITYGVLEAYEWLLRNGNSNLGWRILLELFLDEAEQKRIIASSEKNQEMSSLLPPEFVKNHLRSLELVRALRKEEKTIAEIAEELKGIVGKHFDQVAEYFSPKEAQEAEPIDKDRPSILLTSFVGCKGLSAGHVFIIGVHNESMPRNPEAIQDVEISQFIVALTRTRKQCHIVSASWLVAPINKKKEPVKPFQQSALLNWIPAELIENRGKISAKSFTENLTKAATNEPTNAKRLIR